MTHFPPQFPRLPSWGGCAWGHHVDYSGNAAWKAKAPSSPHLATAALQRGCNPWGLFLHGLGLAPQSTGPVPQGLGLLRHMLSVPLHLVLCPEKLGPVLRHGISSL